MRLTRCHVSLPLQVGETVPLPEDVAAHLTRVLRLREGDPCVLFNGDGQDYPARLVAVGKRSAHAVILSAQPVDNESPLAITLLQGLARGEKMDLILQKATELGVARIVPVESERSEVRLDSERAARRQLHWQQVVIAACEQSGRARVPEVAPVQPIAQAAGQTAGIGLVLDPQAGRTLTSLATPLSACTLAIGPEGGWSPRDLDVLAAAGYLGVRLGPRILRTETAGLAAIAALQALAGDLGR
jgi:16S rRNA (uracil1498-N3)-methyltransferase